MFKRTKELQSLLDASRKALKEAEDKVENKNILIKDMEEQAKALHEENKDLRFENEEQLDLIKRIDKLVNSNKYNNEKAIIDKIKELVSDCKSIN